MNVDLYAKFLQPPVHAIPRQRHGDEKAMVTKKKNFEDTKATIPVTLAPAPFECQSLSYGFRS